MVVERTDPAVKRSRCFVFLKKFCHVTARHYFRTETYEIRRLFIGSGHAHFVDFLVYLPTGCKVFPPREICPDTLFRVELDAICQFVGCFLEKFSRSFFPSARPRFYFRLAARRHCDRRAAGSRSAPLAATPATNERFRLLPPGNSTALAGAVVSVSCDSARQMALGVELVRIPVFYLPNPLAGGALAGVGRKTLTMAGKHLPRAVSPRTLLRLIVTEDGRARTPVGATVEFLSRDFLCVCTRRGRLCFFFWCDDLICISAVFFFRLGRSLA